MWRRILGIGRNGGIEPPNLYPEEVAQRKLLEKKIDLDESLAALVQKYPLNRDNIFLTNHPDDDIGWSTVKYVDPKGAEVTPQAESDNTDPYSSDKNADGQPRPTVIDDPHAKLENPWKKFVFSNEAVDSVVKLINAYFSEHKSEDDFQEAIQSQVNEVIKNAGQSVGRYPKLESDIAAVLVNLAVHKFKSNREMSAAAGEEEIPQADNEHQVRITDDQSDLEETQDSGVPYVETIHEELATMWSNFQRFLAEDHENYLQVLRVLEPGVNVVANYLLTGEKDQKGFKDASEYEEFMMYLLMALKGDEECKTWIEERKELTNLANDFLEAINYSDQEQEIQLPAIHLLLVEAWDFAQMTRTVSNQRYNSGYKQVLDELKRIRTDSTNWKLLYEEVRKMFFLDLPNYSPPERLVDDVETVLEILDAEKQINPNDPEEMQKLRFSQEIYSIFAPLFALATDNNERRQLPLTKRKAKINKSWGIESV